MYSFVLTSRKIYVAGDVRINIEQNSRMELMGDGSLQLKNAQRSDQGDYTCVVFNEHSKDFITYILVVQGQSARSQEMFIFVYSPLYMRHTSLKNLYPTKEEVLCRK